MRALAVAAALVFPSLAVTQAIVVHQVRPSAVDPGAKAFDDPSTAMLPKGVAADAPLAQVMTGTGGTPRNLATLMTVAAEQGYRVLWLE